MKKAMALTPLLCVACLNVFACDPSNTMTQQTGYDNKDVKAAKEDLSQRLGVGLDIIKLVRHEEVTWRDGSLGCPRPGMSYTQALVNGTLIVLRSGEIDYEYHAGGGRAPFYCPSPEPPLSPGTTLGDTHHFLQQEN